MRVTKFIGLAVILLVISTFAVAQAAPAQTAPTVKHVPITNAPSNSGKETFNSYCAVCHGKDGKGNGPAASAMKTPPADLTLLPKNSGGKYPAALVAAVIKGQVTTPSHGGQNMPVWGLLFSTSIGLGHEGQVQQRITNLVTYIEEPAGEVGWASRSELWLKGAGGALRGASRSSQIAIVREGPSFPPAALALTGDCIVPSGRKRAWASG